MELTIVITDYKTNLDGIQELDESLKLLDTKFDIIRVSDNPTYKFTSTNLVTELYCEYGNVSKAKNIGLFAATGDYVCVIDNDDKLLAGDIKQYLNKYDVILPKFQDGLLRKQTNCIIFKRELINKYKLHYLDVGYGEDYYITYQLYYNTAHTVTTTKAPFYFYRLNPNSIRNTITTQHKIDCIKKVKSVMLSLPDINLTKVHRDIDPYIVYGQNKLEEAK